MIVLHEGLHGIVWAIAAGGFHKIKFGFNREMLAPYTHCKIALSKPAYIAGGIAPLFLMGIFPAIISFLAANAYWYLLSLICIFTSAGDVLSCYHLLMVPNGFKIQDHPEKLGFIIIER